MCGRYTYALTNWPKAWRDFLGAAADVTLEKTWNAAPTRRVPVARARPGTDERELLHMTWGLVPGWAKDPSIGSRMINARGETVAEKPSFRAAFKKRRCLIITTGFYEWQHAGEKRAQPWFIRIKGMEVFAFAGLWESWADHAAPARPPLETCAIITIEANEAMANVHHRMPVILPPEDWATWVDPDAQDPVALKKFVRACPADWIEAHPVARTVNNPRHDGPNLIQPAPATASAEAP